MPRIFKSIGVFIIFCFGVNALSAQLDPPSFDCISVGIGGSVTLSWTEPNDPLNEFTAYTVYSYDVGTNTETLVSTIGNYATTNMIVPGVDGNIAQTCYFLQTTSNDGTNQTSVSSDTLCSIFLSAVPGLIPGTVELNWNYPQALDPTLFTGDFTVFMEYPVGEWNIIAEFPASLTNSYTYEVTACTADLNFQIRYSDGGPCDHFSNISGGTFQDQIDPPAPTITSVSVDSLTNDASISWTIPPVIDVGGYILYECIPGLNPMPLDTIFDPNITTWVNPNSDANLGPEQYNIAAFDDCLTNFGEPDPGAANLDCVSSIYLTHTWESCTDVVNLVWTAYQGWNAGVAYYEVYAAEEPDPGSGVFNPSVLLATLPGTDNTFVHEGATLGSSYRYRVRAFSNAPFNNAASNYRTATLAYPDSPDQTRIGRASVNGPNEIEVLADLDATVATPHTYVLERLNPIFNEFEEIDSQDAVASPQITFIDTDVDTGERSYTYKIKVLNNCDDVVDSTNIGKTILLDGLANTDQLVNTLIWSHYEDWQEGVDQYQITRTIDGGPVEILGSVPGSVNFFEDDVSDLLYTEGEFCYQIFASEMPGGVFLPEGSISNELCITQEPVIWIPNAFVVDGFNKEFRPVISFADFDNYRMQIYSRWGNLIFETDQIDEAWDGTYRGEFVREGMYAYYITVADGAGRLYERRGTVVLLKASED
ncbi:MAG: gliding motility-associated C-terminal domain-containing protein [Flavobacteriales bacterium]|nr:gliding motility-associated C-terminal domain-containing protein [Flavobacteriales bacterium]